MRRQNTEHGTTQHFISLYRINPTTIDYSVFQSKVFDLLFKVSLQVFSIEIQPLFFLKPVIQHFHGLQQLRNAFIPIDNTKIYQVLIGSLVKSLRGNSHPVIQYLQFLCGENCLHSLSPIFSQHQNLICLIKHLFYPGFISITFCFVPMHKRAGMHMNNDLTAEPLGPLHYHAFSVHTPLFCHVYMYQFRSMNAKLPQNPHISYKHIQKPPYGRTHGSGRNIRDMSHLQQQGMFQITLRYRPHASDTLGSHANHKYLYSLS